MRASNLTPFENAGGDARTLENTMITQGFGALTWRTPSHTSTNRLHKHTEIINTNAHSHERLRCSAAAGQDARVNSVGTKKETHRVSEMEIIGRRKQGWLARPDRDKEHFGTKWTSVHKCWHRTDAICLPLRRVALAYTHSHTHTQHALSHTPKETMHTHAQPHERTWTHTCINIHTHTTYEG
jgi:hypothetical protein